MIEKRRKLWIGVLWALAIGWIWVLFYFSGQTGAESGELSRKLAQLMQRMFPLLARMAENTLELVLRKLAHAGIFAVEGLLLGLAITETAGDVQVGAVLAGIACVSAAALNELHQYFVEGRSSSGIDVYIDSAGAMCGIAAAMALFCLLRRRRQRMQNVIIS